MITTAPAARRVIRDMYTDAEQLRALKVDGELIGFTFKAGEGYGYLTTGAELGRLGWTRRDAEERGRQAAAGLRLIAFRLPTCDGESELVTFPADNPYRDLAERLPACEDGCAGVAYSAFNTGICAAQSAIYRLYSAGQNAADYLTRAAKHEARGKTWWAGNLRKSVADDRAQMERVAAHWAGKAVCGKVER